MKIIRYLNKAKLALIDNKKYIIKNRKSDIENIYSNLRNRGFNNYIEPTEINDTYEVYPYIDELNYSESDKAIDIILLISMLHNKTTYFEEIDIDNIKEIYESIVKKLDDAYIYYTKLQDEIEEHIYMSPAEQLLMQNISKIYTMLNISRSNIEKFYNSSKTEKLFRKCIIHNNLSLDHIIESDNKYLISWNSSTNDIPVYDLAKFYRKDFDKIEINSIYELYNTKYPYREKEEELFLSLINIPEIVKLNDTNIINTVKVRKLVNYIDKTLLFTLKQDKENKETN